MGDGGDVGGHGSLLAWRCFLVLELSALLRRCALAVCAVRRESAAVVVFLRALWGGEKFIFARFSRGLA